MFFTRKSKMTTPLVEAIHMATDVAMIAFEYQQDREYRPSEKDLRLFETLAEILLQNYSTVTWIAHNMRQRARGEPEASHSRH